MSQIEVFGAGCPVCRDAEAMARRVAGPSDSVAVLDMHQADVAARAEQLGIKRVPSIVIDGGVAGCFNDRGLDEAALRAAISG